MDVTIEKIGDHLKDHGIDFNVLGDASKSVEQIAAIGSCVEKSICYYDGINPDKINGIYDSIIICKPELKIHRKDKNVYILTDHPQICFYIASLLFKEEKKNTIHSQSVIDESAVLGSEVSIGPFCTIEKCVIGNNVIIESGVKIHKNTVIGNDVHIQANSVIGAIGVMWAWDATGKKVRCYQSGRVIIEDNVFIGSNISISRGAFENCPTIIGQNTMISHGTTIGHGVVIGYSNHFANNVTIAGSVTTGKKCFFGSGSTVRPHIILTDNTTVGAGAVVVKNTTTKGLTLVGCPAKGIESSKKNQSGIPSPYNKQK
jgi:UDP-3-O-[3-hydroxymyristoyl] glucosamine N-acyltransferase